VQSSINGGSSFVSAQDAKNNRPRHVIRLDRKYFSFPTPGQSQSVSAINGNVGDGVGSSGSLSRSLDGAHSVPIVELNMSTSMSMELPRSDESLMLDSTSARSAGGVEDEWMSEVLLAGSVKPPGSVTD